MLGAINESALMVRLKNLSQSNLVIYLILVNLIRAVYYVYS